MQRVSVRGLFAGATDGARFIGSSATLLANTVFSISAQLSLRVVNGLAPALRIRNFAGGNAELGAAQFALAEATLAIGAVIGGVVAQHLAVQFRKGELLVASFALYGVTLVALSVAARLEIALVIFAALGFANVIFYVPNVAAVQELAPERLRGRVIGARLALLNLSWLPPIGLAGALADAHPVAALIAFAGVFTTTVAAVGSFVPIVRDLR